MNKTKIEWVKNPDGSQGYTWNPITGCLNGCSYCYARKLANTRLRERYLANTNITPPDFEKERTKLESFETIGKVAFDPFYPRFWEDRLNELCIMGTPDTDPKPKGIFVCDMSDLFGIGIPELWTRSVFDHIKAWPMYRFYLLTKQPQNLIKFSPFPENCWVGVTATDREMYLKVTGADGLDGIKAKVKYISFEPLLEAIHPSEYRLKGIDWVIIGSLTKPTIYPKIEWVQEIVEACDKAGIPVFLKNNLSDLIPVNSNLRYGPAGELRLRQELPNV